MENFNLKIINLKQNIVNIIGDSELPVGVVYYILKDLFDDITNAYQQSLIIEQGLSETNSENNDNSEKDTDKKSEN